MVHVDQYHQCAREMLAILYGVLSHFQLPTVPSSQGFGNIRNAPFLELDN